MGTCVDERTRKARNRRGVCRGRFQETGHGLSGVIAPRILEIRTNAQQLNEQSVFVC